MTTYKNQDAVLADKSEVVVDVHEVAKTLVAISTNPRRALAHMTVHELRALADAARAGLRIAPVSTKPNGLTTATHTIALLEVDVAELRRQLEAANEKVAELEAEREADRYAEMER